MRERVPVAPDLIDDAYLILDARIADKLSRKGNLSFISKHEILGVITEEYKELIDAVHSKDDKNLIEELLDLGVAVMFSLASLSATAATKEI